MLNATESDDEPDTALVHFADGAVTNWHSHPGGQLLYVASGRGRVGTDADGTAMLEPGTLVVAPPHERSLARRGGRRRLHAAVRHLGHDLLVR